MKRNEISIRRVVEDRDAGIYVSTDILNKTITIGKGVKRRCLTLWEAERLEFLLKRQIDRLTGDYPMKADRDNDEFMICPHCSRVEKHEAKFCENCGHKLSSAKEEALALPSKEN